MWHCDKYTFVLPLNIHLIPKLLITSNLNTNVMHDSKCIYHIGKVCHE